MVEVKLIYPKTFKPEISRTWL